ncbi:MAG: hypothetical protein ABI601_05995 [bacterium]
MTSPAFRAAHALPSHDHALRGEALRTFGATEAVVTELLAYGASAFDAQVLRDPPAFPLEDERFVAAWSGYLLDAGREGVFTSLRRRLVQLNFPVASGTSERDDYRAATRRGYMDDALRDGLRLDEPDALELLLHPTPAGRIPVIITACRADFVRLTQALTRRNEPEPIPSSMGACIVGGYNNWARVRELRAEWARRALPGDTVDDAAWAEELRALTPRKELYQDRFILLAAGPYSATSAESMRLAPDEWRRLSATIRLEHECTHYFTRRVFGSMRNTLFDELCADYAGIVAAAGHFRSDWFLRFVGLEQADGYRAGARMENYRGTPALSSEAFVVLQKVVRAAALQLERFDDVRRGRAPLSMTAAIIALARVGLEQLAMVDGSQLLDAELTRVEAVSSEAQSCPR